MNVWSPAPLRKHLCRLAVVSALLSVVVASVGAMAEPLRVLTFGDSLSAGYGLAQADAFPVQLERALKAVGIDAMVINGGVSGDTSAGGLARFGWALADKPHAMILELGANDGLRGLDPAATERNLDGIIHAAKQAGVAVLLSGMRAPPNLGLEYGAEFNSLYPRLAERHDVLFDPFFLEGVAAVPSLNQADGIHPNAAGVAVIVARLAPLVGKLLRALGKPL